MGNDASWYALVWEAMERGYVYPCCRHCAEDYYAVCWDNHELPCPVCLQAPLPQSAEAS